MNDVLIEATIQAVCSIANPRLFKTERGYQGEFYCKLQHILKTKNIVNGVCILEMEYQKASRHGTRQRPDILLHVPTELSKAKVTENNYAMWALKLMADSKQANDDYEKLGIMMKRLKYPLGFFINIATKAHHLEQYRGHFPGRIIAIAVSLHKGIIEVTCAQRLSVKESRAMALETCHCER